MVLAVAHPWASASSYLSSQSVADSRCVAGEEPAKGLEGEVEIGLRRG